jgi:hypothetical protein
MKIRKSLAGIAAGSLALAGVAVVTAPAAQAVNVTARCTTANGVSPPANETNDFDISVTPTSGNAGTGTVDVTVTNNTPYVLAFGAPAIPPGAERVVVAVSVGSERYLIAGPVNTLDAVNVGDPIYNGWSVTGTIDMPTVGAAPPGEEYDVTLDEYYYDSIATNQIFAPADPDGTVVQSTSAGWDPTQRAGIAAAGANGRPTSFDVVCNGASSGDPRAALTPTSLATSLFVVGPNAQVTAVGGQNAATTGYVRGGSGFGTTGTVTLTGTVWDNNVAAGGITAQMCDSAGNVCDAAAAISSNTLTTGPTGVLAGTIRVSPSATTGSRAIKLTQGTNESLTPIVVLAGPTITISPTGGGIGTNVQVTGSSFDPSNPISLYAGIANPKGLCLYLDGPTPGAPCNDVSPADPDWDGVAPNVTVGPFINTTPANPVTAAVASATGELADDLTISTGDPALLIIAAQTGASNSTTLAFDFVDGACTVDDSTAATRAAGCDTFFTVTGEVEAGTLSQGVVAPAAGNSGRTSISLYCTETADSVDPSKAAAGTDCDGDGDYDATPSSTLTTATYDKVISGNLNTIRVVNTRGDQAAWSLTARITDLKSGSTSTILANRISLGLTCTQTTGVSGSSSVQTPGSGTFTQGDDPNVAGYETAGANGAALPNDLTLCQSNGISSSTNSTSGSWDVAGTMSVNVPAFQAAGVYTGLMTVTLV